MGTAFGCTHVSALGHDVQVLVNTPAVSLQITRHPPHELAENWGLHRISQAQRVDFASAARAKFGAVPIFQQAPMEADMSIPES